MINIILFRNPKLTQNDDFISLRIVEVEDNFVITAISKEIFWEEEQTYEKKLDRNYVMDLIYHYLEKFTIQKINWGFASAVEILTLEGVSLQLENLDFSFQRILMAIQDKFDAHVEELLCNNPNLQAVYLMPPNNKFTSFSIHRDNKILVLTPMLYNGKLKATDSRLIERFLDSFFASSCEKMTIEEHFWENGKDTSESWQNYTLQSENLVVHCDAIFYTYMEDKIKAEEKHGRILYRKLEGGNKNE